MRKIFLTLFLGLVFGCLFVFGQENVEDHHDHSTAASQELILRAEQWLRQVSFLAKADEAILALGLKNEKAEAYRAYLERSVMAEERYLFIQKVKEQRIVLSNLKAYEHSLTQKYIDRYEGYKLDEKLQVSRLAELKQKGISITPLGAGEVCRNLDFEEGTTAGWNGFSGYACTSPTPCNLYADLNQHYILNSGYDAIVGGTILPAVAPGGGAYSLRLGNTVNGGNAARLSQTFLVTPANSAFTLKYAVVLEDPGSSHADAERPYFKVSMIDGNGRTIPCADYQVMAKPPIQDFTRVGSTSFYYRPWTVVAIPLTAYIGQNVTVQIDVSDCSLGGHLGYAYIDGSCLPIQVSSQFNVSCNGDPLTLKGPDGFVGYTWTGPGIVGPATNQTVIVNQPGIYSVEVTSFTGSTCKGIVTYEVFGSPNTNAGDDATICLGNSIQLNATGVSSQVTWSPTTGLSDPMIPNPIATPSVTTTYQVTSCGVTDDITITVNPGYQLSISRDTMLCRSAPVSLLATPSLPGTYTYRWSPSTGLSSTVIANPVATPTTSQTYTVTVVDANGCTRTASVNVGVVNGIPTQIGVSPQAKYCGDPVNLTVVGGANFIWTDLSGNPAVGLSCTNCSNPVATPSVTTTYLVTSQNISPCRTTDTITIYSSMFDLTISPDERYCNAATKLLEATVTTPGVFTYSWSPSSSLVGAATSSPTATLNATTVYTVTVTNASGCYRRLSTTQTVLNGIPTAISVAPSSKYCGDPIQLTAVGGTNFSWTDLSGSAPLGLSCNNCSNPVATPSTTSTYVVTAQDNSPCKNKDTITIEALPVFDLTINAPDTTCGPSSTTLVVTPSIAGNYTYAWMPNVSSTNQAAVSVSSTTDYSVVVTNALGCSRTISTKRTVFNPLTSLVLSTSRNDVCEGQTAQLTSQISAPAVNLLNEGFDQSNLNASMWSSVAGGIASDLCGSVTGNAMLFNGLGTRIATTHAFNTSLGATISFYIKFPTGALPCENADFGQNVVLEYSNNGGAAWVVLNTYYEYNYADFTLNTYSIPNAAMTSSTMFRWRQLSSVGSGDVWLLDNVQLAINYNRSLTYSWTPSANLSSGIVPNPIATVNQPITYTLQVTDGKCGISESIALRTVSLKVLMDTTCTNGRPVQLNAVLTGNVSTVGVCGINTGGVVTGALQQYNQGVNATIDGGIGPFRGYFHDYRGQYLYTAAELNALGMVSGKISTIGFTVVSKGSSIPYQNFTIKMGCTNATSLSVVGGWLSTTPVYVNASYATFIGLNTFDLSTPYTWDGISNLVIEICYDNLSYTSDDYVYTTNTSLTQTLINYTDGGSGCSMAPNFALTARPNLHLRSAAVTGGPVFAWTPATHISDPAIHNPVVTDVNNQTYTVSVNAGVCVLTASVVVSTDQLPSLTPEHQTIEICEGQSATISVSSDNGHSFLWTPDSDLNTSVGNTVIASPSISSSYMVQVINDFNCVAVAFADVEIAKDFELSVEASQTTGCIGDPVVLTASGGPNYAWTPVAGIANPTDASVTVSPSVPTTYIVRSANACFEHTKTVDVNLSPNPVVTIDAPASICAGQAITLNATYDPAYTYLWTPGSYTVHNPTVRPSSSRIYEVLVTYGGCSKVVESNVIEVADPIHVQFEVDRTEGEALFSPVFVNLSSGVNSYLWTLGNGQTSNAFIPFPTYDEGVYKVVLQAFNAIGCTGKDSVFLKVTSSDFFIPNLITPNGDGLNDEFEITTHHDIQRWDCKIVNRWGAQVFSQENYTHEWSAQGEADGIYYYYIKDKKNGKEYHGWVQVLAKK